MINIESLEDTRIRLADERKKRRYPFDEMNKSVPSNILSIKGYAIPCKNFINGDCTFHIVDELLDELKSHEPDSDNLFFRNSIIGYEWGDLQRAIVYAERFTNKETVSKVDDKKKVMFRDGFKDRDTVLSEGKLAMADLLTQLYLLCSSLGWDWDKLRELGAQHLKERYEDFKRDGWKEVKK